MGDDPFEKILKYIEEQRKMPHVATNIALKELTWPPRSRTAPSPPKDLASTFPSSGDRPEAEPAPPPAADGASASPDAASPPPAPDAPSGPKDHDDGASS